jgi:F0F1-type ATP synthase assembly protein I
VRDDLQGLGRYGTVGLELSLSIVLGFLAGRWLDQKLQTGGWLTLVGFFFGVAAGFRAIYDAAQRMRRETEQADEQAAQKRRNPQDRNEGDGDGEK